MASTRLRAFALAMAAAMLMALACTPEAMCTAAAAGDVHGCMPAGYSKYIVVFNDTCNIAECTARIEDYCSQGNCQVVYKYSIIKAVAIVAPDSSVARIMDVGDVKYIEKAQPVHIMLDSSVPLIGADQAWASGYTGSGIRVAIVDTGVDTGHPDLASKVVAWTDLVSGRGSPYDDHGHGTHVSSIIAGSGAASGGKYRGVAPGASLMVAKALDASGSGDSSTIMAGVDWAVKNGARVVSLSLGSYQHLQAFDDTVNNAVKAGVVVVAAAGNGGPGSGTISCPGDSPDVITVGATDKSDSVASFSSRGPAFSRVKPDVTNVGVNVIAARGSGTSLGTPVNQYYTSASGTSMATPMTAGVVALLLQADPSLTPSQVKSALTSTAKRIGSGVPNNNAGYGRVQAKAAVDYVLSAASPTPSPSPQPTGYGVTTTHRWASYNGVNKPIEQFNVATGNTVAQSVYYLNTGNMPDSYTVSVSGIPAGWWRFTLYGTALVQPGQGRYGNVYITPTTSGTYAFNVTVTSNGDGNRSSAQSYTLYVGSVPSPGPSPSPSAGPSPSPSPTPAGNSVIKGLKYVDQNRNGRLDAGEPRLQGVTIRLYYANGTLLAQAVTDRNGYYSFSRLPAGTYVIQEVTPSGYTATTPSRVTVNLRANTVYTQHFGNARA